MQPELKFLTFARVGNLSEIKNMLSSNPRLIDSVDQYGANALIYALDIKNIELAIYLIEKGADIMQVDMFKKEIPKMIEDLGDKKLKAVFDKRAKEVWEQLSYKKSQFGDNPFEKFSIEGFCSLEVEEDYSKINLNNRNIFNGLVRTFLCGLKQEMTVIRNGSKSLMTPKTFNDNKILSQTIVIDYITQVPTFLKDTDYILSKGAFAQYISTEEIIERKKNILSQLGILYLIDYDLKNLVTKIQNQSVKFEN